MAVDLDFLVQLKEGLHEGEEAEEAVLKGR